ncbi:hypothetical protein F3Y22_tig00111877pilonHSYRG00273 [Hibiscus syriacus]|uniref:Protein kinase domain-containing protein n=1 Tax=Hibiscus syriacus TaxID=106335 RepID=A0A6A2XA45_HIBSY|nr:hypothetical protein F3Y22_tig00111877pilonHSYRG00273 [Hibiscus syriacus]
MLSMGGFLRIFNAYSNNVKGPLPLDNPVVGGNDTDRQALLYFKAKITGDQLKIMESWNSSIHFCQWRDERLVGNNFYNEIPQEIGPLKRLETLEPMNNAISGEIPSNLSTCSKLTLFDMRGNQLTAEIPASLGLLSNLKVLGVHNNSLRGSIPPSLGNLSSLEMLGLSFNALSGIIPEPLGRLANLLVFVVYENEISGTIPISMFNPSSLRVFDIGENKIEGELDLSHNSLSGLLPNSLGCCVSLEKLLLEGNLFEGSIPSSLSSLRGLDTFDISHNNLSGVCKNGSATFVDGNWVALIFTSLLILCILRATDGFATQNLFSSGNFSSLYKGIFEESGATIAVKVLNLLNRGSSRSFLAECEALKNIRHRNLVKMLLMHWNIYSIVVKRRSFIVTSSQGISTLEYSTRSFISDFGLEKVLYESSLNHPPNQSSSLGIRGTIGYAPPEYDMGSELSTKGGVYSYGILLLEMFTGKRPTDERFEEGPSLLNFVREAFPDQMIEIIDPILLQESVRGGTVAYGTRNENRMRNDSLQCLNLIFGIGLTCSAKSPSERMGVNEVVTKLCSARDKLLRPTPRFVVVFKRHTPLNHQVMILSYLSKYFLTCATFTSRFC